MLRLRSSDAALPSPRSPPDLANMELAAMEEAFREAGLPKLRAQAGLPVDLPQGRHRLRADVGPRQSSCARSWPSGSASPRPQLVHEARSTDGTRKFLFQLADGKRIESVYIPDTPKQTFCISSQVGCAMDCDFCLTGKMGFVRNLTPGEITGQVRVLAEATGLRDKPFNIVLMGMGEPLHNYDAVMSSLRVLADGQGLAVPPRRVTLSTVGVLPAMERLAKEPVMPNLAVSLHATTNATRDRIAPINRKYPLEQLLDACRRFPLNRRRQIMFEYVLLDGVNDTPRGRAAAGQPARRHQGQGQPAAAERRAPRAFLDERPSDERDRSRVAFVVACSDTARLGITGSFASLSIAGTTPTVDNVTRRGGIARPC